MICPLKKYDFHSGSESDGLQIFWRIAQASPQSSVIHCGHTRVNSEQCPYLLAFHAHHYNNYPDPPKILWQGISRLQITMLGSAGTIKDHI